MGDSRYAPGGKLFSTLVAIVEVFDGVAGVAVDFAIDRAGGLLDDMHGRFFGAGVTAFVAQLGAQLATAVF